MEAAKILSDCAALGGAHAAEDAFHAARALSRADRDEEAMVAYAAVARRYPKTQWADEASYFVPYLHMLHGEWTQAARGFDDYVKHYPEGRERAEASRFRALTHLLAKEHKSARKLYERLADDEKDPLTAARMANMAALAALRDGDRTHAVARWTEVARSRPLSWPALVARARLAEAGAEIPVAIEGKESAETATLGAPPSPAPAPLTVTLPPPADTLHAIGLDADAEVALRDREAFVTGSAAGRGVEALCGAYGLLGRARRRYQIGQQAPGNALMTAPGPRTQWIWDCVYPRPYEGHVRSLEAS
jgi:soluble lytic murein transglycosylase